MDSSRRLACFEFGGMCSILPFRLYRTTTPCSSDILASFNFVRVLLQCMLLKLQGLIAPNPVNANFSASGTTGLYIPWHTAHSMPAYWKVTV